VDTTDANRDSRLPPPLLDAWRATRYEVTGAAPPFALTVDAPSAELAACHLAYGVGCSAFITAWNPGARPAAADANARAGAALEAALHARGYRFLAGRSVDPTGRWPAEVSVLALGLGRAEASAIALAFGQAGLVYAGADAVPRLVPLA